MHLVFVYRPLIYQLKGYESQNYTVVSYQVVVFCFVFKGTGEEKRFLCTNESIYINYI